jgi:hypothetical protein
MFLPHEANVTCSFGKPVVLTGFGVVLDSELDSFIPVNQIAPTPGGPPGGKANLI